jgi:hypothetical protein
MAGHCLIMAVKHCIAWQDRFNRLPDDLMNRFSQSSEQFIGTTAGQCHEWQNYDGFNQKYQEEQPDDSARLFDRYRYENL